LGGVGRDFVDITKARLAPGRAHFYMAEGQMLKVDGQRPIDVVQLLGHSRMFQKQLLIPFNIQSL
jgi:hypothetical protein